MRIAFAGTPEFAAYSLKALVDAGHQIAFVLTQPDRPAGRGLKSLPSSVKQVAQDNGILVYQPYSLQSDQIVDVIKAAEIDCLVVAAYGLLVPPNILAIPKYGCLNIHASLLPRWRGAAPIQRAILHGDKKTGVCIMQMESGLDTGPVLLHEELFILAADTASSLHDKLKEIGASLISQIIAHLDAEEEIKSIGQPDEGITYAEKLKKEEAIIYWNKSAIEIDRQVRAFNPFPVAQTFWRDHAIRIWSGYPDMKSKASSAVLPGTVIQINKESLVIACGDGLYNITELQKAGGKRLSTTAFLTGNKMNVGDLFSMPQISVTTNHSL